MRKTILSILLIIILVFSVTACKKEKVEDDKPDTKTEKLAYNIVNAIEKAYADYYSFTDREPTYNELSKQFNDDNESIGAKMYYGIVSVENTDVKCKDTLDKESQYVVTCETRDTEKSYSTKALKINTSR